MAKNKLFTCPYCFADSKASEIHFRCDNDGCAPDKPDPHLSHYLRRKPEHGPIKMRPWINPYPPGKTSSKVPTSAKCTECHHVAKDILCPKCHNQIARSTLEGRDILISVVGTRGAGKSNYIGVLINQIKTERFGSSFNVTVRAINDAVDTMYNQAFGRYLYAVNEEGYSLRLPPTESSLDKIQREAYEPYIYSMRFKGRGAFGNITEDFNLVIFDIAGEDAQKLHNMKNVARYIAKSTGIIFLIDPTQMHGVTPHLPKDVKNRAFREYNEITASKVIENMHDQIMRESPGNREVKTPVAVVFSKLDALIWDDGKYEEPPLITDNRDRTILSGQSPHYNIGALDLKNRDEVSKSIKRLLGDWDEGNTMRMLEGHYSNYSFFAISALGFGFELFANDKTTRPVPHRVEDPLLWILKEKAVIKGKGKSSFKNTRLSFKYKVRPLSTMFKVMSIIILCVLLALPLALAGINMRNFNANAFLNIEMTSVSPRTGLRGQTTVSANFNVTNSNFGWGRQRISYTLIRQTGGQHEVVYYQEHMVRAFSYWFVFTDRTVPLFSHDFAPLSDYLLTVYLNGVPFTPVMLHGE